MSKILKYIILVTLMSGVTAAAGFGPETAPEPLLLRDGFSLAGVDGKLVSSDGNDVWFFELRQDVNDYRAIAKAGTKLELLPSSTLERMVADAKTRSTPIYRLWNAEVTKYKGRNFIFPRYFLPLREPEEEEQKTQDGEQKTEDKREKTMDEKTMDDGRSKSRPSVQQPPTSDPNTFEIAVNEPNDVLTVPPEIMERLKAQQERPATSRLRQITDSNEALGGESASGAPTHTRGADSVLVDRTAFLVEQGDGGFAFVPDALGRNVQRLSLRLLPCEILELTERMQSAEPEKLRFKIAGILTTYKDEKYLLLQKATRTYSHGNFGR